MSMGPIGGVVGSAAGAPLSQTKGSETERSQRDASAQARQTETDAKAEQAAGIGQTEEDQQASDRDADGRRLWEPPVTGEENQAADDSPADEPHQSKDTTGQAGNQLDLMG